MLHILNLSITNQVIPSSWKKAIVSPIHKAGSQTDTNNYRPISCICLPAKLLEKCVHKQLMTYLEEENLLYDHQYGFRQNRSTLQAQIEFLNKVHTSLNNKDHCRAAFLDFKKAFDTVNHTILLDKLETMGVRGLENKWFKNYLSGREQQVSINGLLSEPGIVTCGVPQGTTLGPLLFLIYINDLGRIIEHSKIQLFADDTILYSIHKSGKQTNDNLQKDLNQVYLWCRANKISINAGKSNTMTISFNNNRNDPDIGNLMTLGSQKLEEVASYKYLGTEIDNKLSFKGHLNKTLNRVGHKLYMLRKIRDSLTEQAARDIYKMAIMPYIDMSDILYAVGPVAKLNKLQVGTSKSGNKNYQKTTQPNKC